MYINNQCCFLGFAVTLYTSYTLLCTSCICFVMSLFVACWFCLLTVIERQFPEIPVRPINMQPSYKPHGKSSSLLAAGHPLDY